MADDAPDRPSHSAAARARRGRQRQLLHRTPHDQRGRPTGAVFSRELGAGERLDDERRQADRRSRRAGEPGGVARRARPDRAVSDAAGRRASCRQRLGTAAVRWQGAHARKHPRAPDRRRRQRGRQDAGAARRRRATPVTFGRDERDRGSRGNAAAGVLGGGESRRRRQLDAGDARPGHRIVQGAQPPERRARPALSAQPRTRRRQRARRARQV